MTIKDIFRKKIPVQSTAGFSRECCDFPPKWNEVGQFIHDNFNRTFRDTVDQDGYLIKQKLQDGGLFHDC
ncbi:MAG: hypothetical protein ACFFCS_20395 [Candidatus Hodarchaeota archaeon]